VLGGYFPSDEAASPLLYPALRNLEKDWKMPPVAWRQAVKQLAILFDERFTSALTSELH
jgi:transposase-like protein